MRRAIFEPLAKNLLLNLFITNIFISLTMLYKNTVKTMENSKMAIKSLMKTLKSFFSKKEVSISRKPFYNKSSKGLEKHSKLQAPT